MIPVHLLLIDIGVVALFTLAVVDIIHHGSLFADLRGWAEVASPTLNRFISCPFCLSFWMAALGTLFVMPVLHTPEQYYMPSTILICLGGMRLSNILNDVLHGITRIHSEKFADPVFTDEEEEEPADTKPPVRQELPDGYHYFQFNLGDSLEGTIGATADVIAKTDMEALLHLQRAMEDADVTIIETADDGDKKVEKITVYFTPDNLNISHVSHSAPAVTDG